MTYQYGQRRFVAEFGSPMLVIVDPRNVHLASGLRNGTGGIASRCKSALQHARATGNVSQDELRQTQYNVDQFQKVLEDSTSP